MMGIKKITREDQDRRNKSKGRCGKRKWENGEATLKVRLDSAYIRQQKI